MVRHAVYRGRYFLQMFQQHGYKIGEYWQWLRSRSDFFEIRTEHAAMALVLMVFMALLDEFLTSTSVTVAMFVFAAFWFGSVRRYVDPDEKKPLVFTHRMIRLATLYAAVGAVIPLTGLHQAFEQGLYIPDAYVLVFSLLVADLLMPVLLPLVAGLLYPLEQYIQKRFKNRARARLAAMPDLKVIGITGSYGKTSTKEAISRVLQERYNVCTAPGSYNTPMGVCKVINEQLQSHHQVLVLEMGARYKGNIDELCRIASPDVGVLTNIGKAHLETFGSVENIARTKSELIHHLGPGKQAVLNADDTRVMQIQVPEGVEVLTAGLGNGDLRADNITYDHNGCRFTVHHDRQGISETFQTRLIGAHNVHNIVIAAAVGLHFGLRLKTASVAVQRLEPVKHRMQMKQNNGITVIDDAFNSNPVGARNAVQTLSRFNSGRRFIITPGMIELGEEQDQENRRFGEKIAECDIDRVILVGPRQTEPIYSGLEQSGFDMQRVQVVKSLQEANRMVQQDLRRGDVVLYENDLPDTYNE